MKKLLLGDEAIAQGALDAGLSGVYAYPGTPSTEITEYIQGSALAREWGVHSRWSTNEKTAMEAALGMSFMGKRAMVCMKHVGLNVCADPFVNSAMTGKRHQDNKTSSTTMLRLLTGYCCLLLLENVMLSLLRNKQNSKLLQKRVHTINMRMLLIIPWVLSLRELPITT